MWSGGSAALEQPGQGRQEIVGDRAAQAAIGQLDDVVVGASRVAAAEQQLAVDAELAELVDDDGEPPPGGMRPAGGARGSSCRRRESR